MRILSIDAEPIAELRFLDAGARPNDVQQKSLPVLHALVDRLPDSLTALVATADLQGREMPERGQRGPLRLIGETLPEWLDREVFPRLDWPSSKTMGAILAGDFYTVPGAVQRGGTGDVMEVWDAFGDWFAWTAGVAGNHDLFGDRLTPPARFAHRKLFYLDGELIEIGGLRVAGVGGIVGDTRRPHRKGNDEYVAILELIMGKSPDLLVMHDGPDVAALRLRGNSSIRETIESCPPLLVIRGHAHWEPPLVELANGAQVLNVHERVVLLRAAGMS